MHTDPADAHYWDPADLEAEARRVYELCHGCRMCFNLCPSFPTLFGLYEGIPLEARGHDYTALPDKISIFYRPIVETCTSTVEIRDEIRTTVLHEVAHFFGIDDEDLDEWGY